MLIKISMSSIKSGEWHEYLVRFVLGGAATVITGLITERFGAAIGGLFLALPGIFCASATLVEKHELRKKRTAGVEGTRRGRQAAALDAAGAALASLGLLSFAGVFYLLSDKGGLLALACGCAAWLVVSTGAWAASREAARLRGRR